MVPMRNWLDVSLCKIETSLRAFEFDLEIHSVLACFILQTDTSKISCLLFVIYTPITKDNVVRVCNQHKRTGAHMLQL
jgi:hypothetical protein